MSERAAALDADLDPLLVAALCGTIGPDQVGPGPLFHQDGPGDTRAPGPVLAELTAQSVAQADELSDDEVIGTMHAARRQANLADYQQTVMIAVFTRRRRAEFEAALAAGKPTGCRDGEFPGAELAMELTETQAEAGLRSDTAVELTTRLPRTLALMADGALDLGRAMIIAQRTLILSDADAAYADEVLAAVAAGLRPDQLARKAAALEMKLAAEAVKARKERARNLDQRVEVQREASGNASLAGRELSTADALASKAHIDALALQLRQSGRVEGTLPRLRALVLTDLTQGRDPLDRIQHPPAAGPAPLPAMINLLVPADTLLGQGTAPAQAGAWDLLDPDETKTIVRAASQHPRSRWCVTVLGTDGTDGTAVAHGCASGRHPWTGDDPPTDLPTDPAAENGPGPPRHRPLLELLRRLNVTFDPIARDACDHAHAEDRYVPSRRLRHLLRARNQTCTAPACNAQAVYCDYDHTVPYPDGPTCECNLNPKCRRHHRVKQAPGWRVSQPSPDTAEWVTPAGRVHTVKPTGYDY
jgi:hypothetical protein